MKKNRFFALSLFIFVLGLSSSVFAQFKEKELANREMWEEFLKTAEVVEADQPFGAREAVTRPWKLTLEKDGVTINALWKNPQGRMKGFMEHWKWEIAAYCLDKYLGLCMVPPTVEKRFKGDRGSCQMWVDYKMSLKTKFEDKIKTPSYKIFYWNRALFLQRAFDNLIANEDRHQNQFLITEDWRMLLIDHSRSFRTSKKFTKKLIYDDKYHEGPRLMKQLPKHFYEKLKSLDAVIIQETVGEYLTEKEIECVLVRKNLIVDWIEKRIKKLSEDKVLY